MSGRAADPPARSSWRTAQGRLVALALCLLCIGYAAFYWSRLKGGASIDFPSFWLGAELAFDQGEVPFGAAFDRAAVALDRYVHPFVYPPATLVFLRPLALFGLAEAGLAFLVLNIALAIGAGLLLVRLWHRDIGHPPHPLAAAFIVLFAMAAQATRITLGHGQLNLVILCAILAAVSLMNRAHWRGALAGTLFALAIALKLYVVVALGPLVLRGRWRVPLVAMLILLVSVAASFLLLPAGSWTAWITEILGQSDARTFAGRFDLASDNNVSVTGVFLRLEDAVGEAWRPVLSATRLAILGLVLLATAVCTFLLRNHRHVSMAELSAYLCLVVLVPANAWVHYTAFAIPAAVVGLLMTLRHRSVAIGVFAVPSALVVLHNPFGIAARLVPDLMATSPNDALTVAVIVLWALNLALALRSRDRSRYSPA